MDGEYHDDKPNVTQLDEKWILLGVLGVLIVVFITIISFTSSGERVGQSDKPCIGNICFYDEVSSEFSEDDEERREREKIQEES